MGFHPGMKVRLARQIDGLTQEELAQQLADATGDDTWTRDTVVNLETGRKKFTWPIIMNIAYVQDRPLEFYLVAPGARVPGFDRVNPGYVKGGWAPLVIPWETDETALLDIAS